MTSDDSFDKLGDDDFDTLDDAFAEFESEISMMSKDTDAILDSIREAALPTPRKKRSIASMMELHKRASLRGGNDTDTDDDDMTDDGSVPEEVRLSLAALAAELAQFDKKMKANPGTVSEEIKKLEALDDDFKPVQEAPKLFEENLFLKVALVWLVLVLIRIKISRWGLLNEEGYITILPLLQGLRSSA
jgi:hypothetical protein